MQILLKLSQSRIHVLSKDEFLLRWNRSCFGLQNCCRWCDRWCTSRRCSYSRNGGSSYCRVKGLELDRRLSSLAGRRCSSRGRVLGLALRRWLANLRHRLNYSLTPTAVCRRIELESRRTCRLGRWLWHNRLESRGSGSIWICNLLSRCNILLWSGIESNRCLPWQRLQSLVIHSISTYRWWIHVVTLGCCLLVVILIDDRLLLLTILVRRWRRLDHIVSRTVCLSRWGHWPELIWGCGIRLLRRCNRLIVSTTCLIVPERHLEWILDGSGRLAIVALRTRLLLLLLLLLCGWCQHSRIMLLLISIHIELRWPKCIWTCNSINRWCG